MALGECERPGPRPAVNLGSRAVSLLRRTHRAVAQFAWRGTFWEEKPKLAE